MSCQPSILLHVKVYPQAHKNRLIAYQEGRLHIKIAAKAIDGKANEALIEYLCDLFDLSKSCFEIIKGASAPFKVIQIRHMDRQEMERVLAAELPDYKASVSDKIDEPYNDR